MHGRSLEWNGIRWNSTAHCWRSEWLKSRSSVNRIYTQSRTGRTSLCGPNFRLRSLAWLLWSVKIKCGYVHFSFSFFFSFWSTNITLYFRVSHAVGPLILRLSSEAEFDRSSPEEVPRKNQLDRSTFIMQDAIEYHLAAWKKWTLSIESEMVIVVSCFKELIVRI